MNRTIISVGIIVITIFICIFSILVIRHECNELTEVINTIIENVENDNSEAAAASAEELTKKWKVTSKHLSFFIGDDDIELINDCIARISPLIEEECDEAASESKSLERKIRRIYVRDIPYIHNIF